MTLTLDFLRNFKIHFEIPKLYGMTMYSLLLLVYLDKILFAIETFNFDVLAIYVILEIIK